MNKLCLLACLLVPVVASAQIAPKVVFVGENFTSAWQTTTEFTANPNWIGAGLPDGLFVGSGEVLQEFQASVIDQHPAFVHIMTGFGDIETVKDSTPLGVVVQSWESDLTTMVAMARKANIKVILGNLPASVSPEFNPGAVQLFNAWLDQYGRANHIPVVNYHDALCQCVGSTKPYDTYAPSLLGDPNAPLPTPNDAGYALITQMAQTAIATYGLSVKSGYLSNVLLPDANVPLNQYQQVNSVLTGSELIFTAQAKWSDGVVRPLLNQDFDGLQGIWTSSNPAVMYVNQQGQAVAYGVGKTTISFKSASGVPFSPWMMTVETEEVQ